MNPPSPAGKDPAISRPEAEAMIKMLDQELALQRAKLATRQQSPGASAARWGALVFVLMLLLGVMIWGFAKLQTVKLETPVRRPPPPPAAPARR